MQNTGRCTQHSNTVNSDGYIIFPSWTCQDEAVSGNICMYTYTYIHMG